MVFYEGEIIEEIKPGDFRQTRTAFSMHILRLCIMLCRDDDFAVYDEKSLIKNQEPEVTR